MPESDINVVITRLGLLSEDVGELKENYCRWNEAVESIARANMDMWLTTTFIWPRILLRTFTGI